MKLSFKAIIDAVNKHNAASAIGTLEFLDNEIKQWESQHWQMQRLKGYNGTPPPPPSAIV